MRIIMVIPAAVAIALVIWLILEWAQPDDTADLSIDTPEGEISVDVDSGN